ncbi:MAG: fused isobutyryl-CoA mutase/GTPase IcmF [Acidimicrobiales bacterium]
MHRPAHPVRFVTAASLFDGHDAAINIIRRILQDQGAEVIHLGHNRSVDEVVAAAVSEDVQGVAVSAYQGGHVEYFEYLVDRLRDVGRSDVRVFGGGGGVIVEPEIERLEAYGVAHIFSPADGQRLGLPKMVNELIRECDRDLAADFPESIDGLFAGEPRLLARVLTAFESGEAPAWALQEIRRVSEHHQVPILGITGTGGSGKSSLTDELIRRFRHDLSDKLRIAVLAVDPSRRRGGGALLGDRIRMNAIDSPQIFFRSFATRDANAVLPRAFVDITAACGAAGFDLIMVETPGIGQGESAIVDVADVSLYVMTPEYGAASQLDKINMIDLAEMIAINKFDRRGGEDAMRDVSRQWARTHRGSASAADVAPVFGTIASHFNDDGLSALYQATKSALESHGLVHQDGILPPITTRRSSRSAPIVPSNRQGYLAEIGSVIRDYHERTEQLAEVSRTLQHLRVVEALAAERGVEVTGFDALHEGFELDESSRRLLEQWPSIKARYLADEYTAESRSGVRTVPTRRTSLSGTEIPRVALPRYSDDGDLLAWLRRENLPGHFPYTAGVFEFKRDEEDPTRMFAGEGDPARTNRRFHLLADGQPATRLSTAFDPVTLYGFDPDERPDIYGKIGTSGVSIATLDDMKDLYAGFDLCDANTSVSMTINGPAPSILAMFFNTAIDQQVERREKELGRPLRTDEHRQLSEQTLHRVRGTVQADILKEDQGQNTCIFSTEFSLGVMADIQQYFIDHKVKNFYSVSISGYHIAEAGANPITQLAFTLANGFTYVESYLARGMAIDDFAGNLSFFFSNGMDPEYSVIGRVARRIWAIAMRDRYGANERSQKLKYHIQTSGRSLHAQEISFNDIRTTLQALCAVYDNANSLHTNAYDEAITTPTDESVRRALAIQMIINKEWGLSMNENPLQGSFIIEELTDLVEEAVLLELERLSERGGVLGAMETGYQRGRIQDDSLDYENRKHDGSLPIIGVNTFVSDAPDESVRELRLARGTEEERRNQLRRLAEFERRHEAERPGAIAKLQEVARSGGNVFSELMDTVRHATLGEISAALFEIGGAYRRSM